jgi:hypothetical protein
MLDTMYERLVALLGKSPDQHLSMLSAIESELDEATIIKSRDNEYKFYDLPQSGITLDFSGQKNIFVAFTLFLDLGNDAPGQCYRGNLPYGISRDDTKQILEARVPGITMAVKDYRYDLDLRPLIMQCHFAADTKRLSFISVDYEFE